MAVDDLNGKMQTLTITCTTQIIATEVKAAIIIQGHKIIQKFFEFKNKLSMTKCWMSG